MMPYDDEDWRRLSREFLTVNTCGGIVTRDGIEDACGKPATAIIDGRGTEDESFWAACTYHAHRFGSGRCVPLADLLASVGHVVRESRVKSPMTGARAPSTRAVQLVGYMLAPSRPAAAETAERAGRGTG